MPFQQCKLLRIDENLPLEPFPGTRRQLHQTKILHDTILILSNLSKELSDQDKLSPSLPGFLPACLPDCLNGVPHCHILPATEFPPSCGVMLLAPQGLRKTGCV